MNKQYESQFGIRIHAQIQTIGGRVFEFQPEHLLCEKCWSFADSAYAHASYFGAVSYGDTEGHSIHCSKVSK